MAEINVWTFILFGAGCWLFYKGFAWQRQKKLIEDTPTSTCRGVAMGRAELYGNPVAIKKLIAPFTKEDCVYYMYAIEEYRKQGKNSRWVLVKSGEERVPFHLKDGTGQVLVDPAGADIDIPHDYQKTTGMFGKPPAPVQAFMDKNNIRIGGFLGMHNDWRFTEYHIEEKDKIYIMGTAGNNPAVKEGTARTSADAVMVQKGKDWYYISDKSEKAVLSTLRWKMMGGWIGGGLLVVITLAWFLAFLGVFG